MKKFPLSTSHPIGAFGDSILALSALDAHCFDMDHATVDAKIANSVLVKWYNP